jgi:MFS family permease
MLGTVTLLFSALGGWIAGMLADRYGRVRILQITIVWFSVCTFLIGFAQSFEQVFVLRALQGLGFGGEWAVGSVLMGEIVRAQYRGRAVGTVQSGWAVGWGIAALLYTLAFSWLPEEWAWRSLFWFSVLPSVLVIYIRRNVPEPEVYTQSRAANDDSIAAVSPWTIFSPALLKTTLLAALLCTGVQGGYYAVMTWLPTFLKTERHLSVIGTGAYLSVIIMIDLDNVEKFAQDHDVPFSNYASLTRAAEVQSLIQTEIDKVNTKFARVEQIKQFRLLDTQLTAEDDELTPTMKLKRKFVEKKYSDLIESMYTT